MPGRYHGVFPMLVTPFTPSGTIDDEDLRRLLDFVLGAGAHGVSILGLGGEASRLSSTERRAVARLVLSQAGGHRVIVGCSADETTTSMDLARDAVDHGASIVMLAPPSRPDWDRNRLLDHFQRVAEGIAPAPVMIQDAPAFVGVALDETFATDLARFQPSVLYAKPEGLPAAEWAVRLSSAGLAVFGGHGGVYAMDVFEAGAVGLDSRMRSARPVQWSIRRVRGRRDRQSVATLLLPPTSRRVRVPRARLLHRLREAHPCHAGDSSK